MIKKTLFLFFIILLSSFAAKAQMDSLYERPGEKQIKNDSCISFNKHYIKSFFIDGINTISSPFHWKKKQWLLSTLIAGAGIYSYNYDESIHEFFNDNSNKTTNNISNIFDYSIIAIPAMGAIYTYGFSKNKCRTENTLLLSVKAMIISEVGIQLIKRLSHRHRPDNHLNIDPYIWDGPAFSDNFASFPSGHTAMAFAMASVISSEYKGFWVSFISYSYAGLMALSRLNNNEHWASDVVIGAGLGYACGKLVFNNSKNKIFKIRPLFSNKINGLSFSLNI